MSYPPFESTVSVDGFVRVEGSGKENLVKYNIPHGHEKANQNNNIIIVIGKHKYYALFSVQLLECAGTEKGTIKAPLKVLKPIDRVWQNDDPAVLKFYLAAIKFQTLYEKSPLDIDSLKALIHNPFGYPFYIHDYTISEKITPRSLSPVTVGYEKVNVEVTVDKHKNHYSVQCDLTIGKTRFPFQRTSIHYDYFLVCEQQWNLCDNINLLSIISYFKECNNMLAISFDVFENFRHDVLQKMELFIPVNYIYLDAAPDNVKTKSHALEKIIYLSDLDNYVTLNPVIRYGNTEIPILTRRQMYHDDAQGNQQKLKRDTKAEDDFVALLLKQRTEFLEQLENPLLYFYIPKHEFVNADWFLPAFEDWRKHDIAILGFNTLKENKLNQHKASITIMVSSGINWFNAAVKVRYGKEEVALKLLQKAVRNKGKYIQLDDGTLGILPEEWIKKFSAYFQAGEITGEDTLQISKTNYSILSTLYKEHELKADVREEVKYYQTNLASIPALKQVALPKALTATLRPYQHQGLNWLNFLDDANFGGCLADDMGLGKSLQIISFILALIEKRNAHTHLLIVPTTLIYNWQQEFLKFAGSLSVYIHHGAGRSKSSKPFARHDVVITSYGTLIADVGFLNDFVFDYIFLDESQNIKNPSSQRYQAAKLLRSRNKIIISGTPIENNTFDLFAQFSFACPGLLGTKQYFRDTFAIPIDKFKSNRTALALQARINPFILRRTKEEVAKDLPEKTEMVIYCEMDTAQRLVYDRYEKEFRDFITGEGEDIAKHTINILRGLTRLRQICNAPALVDDGHPAAEDSSTKIEVLMERIINLSGKHKILIFSQFVSMLDLLKTRLMKEDIPHTYLTGSTRRRDHVVDQFQNNDDIRVFLISLKAGGVGLNLTAADYVFIVDPWWNPAVENQAIDRIYRIGQQKNVVAVRLICKNTIEEKIMLMQQAKTRLSSDLLSTDLSVFKQMKKQDILALTEH